MITDSSQPIKNIQRHEQNNRYEALSDITKFIQNSEQDTQSEGGLHD